MRRGQRALRDDHQLRVRERSDRRLHQTVHRRLERKDAVRGAATHYFIQHFFDAGGLDEAAPGPK